MTWKLGLIFRMWSTFPIQRLLNSYPSPPRAEICPGLGSPEGRAVFSLLSELRDGKGVELLLEALPILARQVRQRVFLPIWGEIYDRDSRFSFACPSG
jgi:hypothetical protein